jgi:hypothetical protein
VSNEEQGEEIDHVLDVLSKPLSRYILSVLAGVNPGTFTGVIDSQNEYSEDETDEP